MARLEFRSISRKREDRADFRDGIESPRAESTSIIAGMKFKSNLLYGAGTLGLAARQLSANFSLERKRRGKYAAYTSRPPFSASRTSNT